VVRIIRDAFYHPEGVLIGEAPAEPQTAAWRLAPPPPPPEVPFDEEAPPASPWGDDAWAAPEPVDQGLHPDELEAQQKLYEAEQLLTEAHAEAERLLAAAQQQAASLLARAQSDAAGELEQARAEVAGLHENAAAAADEARAAAEQAGHAEGFAKGEAEGMEHGHAEGMAKAELETSNRIAQVTQLAESAAVDRRELLHAAEDEVVRLALQIAEKVLHREVQLDRRLVNHMAETALQYVAVDGQVRLRVNPTDLSELSAYWLRRHGEVEGERSYELMGDPEVARGGVVIETRAGRVDARLETQLEEVARSLGAMPDESIFAE
jgi:flagellar biosynthesis/type III secretory pathway protein FliH